MSGHLSAELSVLSTFPRHAGHNSSATRRITFHKQRENRAFLTLCEVDEFGNYSSPHYRGTVIFHRVPKGRPTGCGNAHCDMVDRAALPPVCKLPVTLPKKARTVVSPCSATVMSCCQENGLGFHLFSFQVSS
ncbi:Death domain-containing protein 1 [Arapaima gigas]